MESPALFTFVLRCSGIFYNQYYKIINRKTLYDYSASVRTYNCSNCLCEKPKPNIFRISGFLRPVGTLICGFDYAKLH